MNFLYIMTGASILASFVLNHTKTVQAFRIAVRQMLKISIPFLSMLILVAVTLFFISDEIIVHYLSNNNKYTGTIIASVFGSLTVMPGFIAYPLCGILLKKKVSYTIIASFITTLMMVGIFTFPIEKSYFGVRVTILRNVISYVIAIIIALITGIFYGEIL